MNNPLLIEDINVYSTPFLVRAFVMPLQTNQEWFIDKMIEIAGSNSSHFLDSDNW